MKKIIYLDCPTGIAGDMFLAAMFDAGADFDDIKQQLAKLPLGEWQMQLEQCQKKGIAAKHLNIRFPHQHHHRTYADIRGMIEQTDWENRAKSLALDMFRVLAEAEAKVHGCTAEEVHFHEVGAVDSILDMCGAALAICNLGIEQIYFKRLPLSQGFVDCAHGRMSLPAPAVAELLQGIQLLPSDLVGETITPTGAAILIGSNAKQECPAFRLINTGYGAGTRDFEQLPNVLRLLLGTMDESGQEQDMVDVLRSNIDDSSGELLAELWQQAFNQGALDMSYSPILMKKGRPGWALEMIVPYGTAAQFAKLIFDMTTSIGLRFSSEQRFVLPRESSIVSTPYGQISIKLAGNTVAPEAEDVKAAANKHNRSFKEVYQAAIASYLNSKQK